MEMNEVVELTKRDLEANPSAIGESIVKLAMDIDRTRDNLSDIEQRGFWKRLTNNNTRDLASAMIQQNDTISAFLTIVQGVIFLSFNNIVVLSGIMDSITKQEHTNDLRDNKYVDMAKEYLSEAIKSAQRTTKNTQDIIVIKDRLVDFYKNQSQQDKLIEDLKVELKQYHLTNGQQDEILAKVTNRLNKKDRIDRQQDQIIENLQEELEKQNVVDQQQTEIIDFVKEEIRQQQELDDVQSELIAELEQRVAENKAFIKQQGAIDQEQTSLIENLTYCLEEMKASYEQMAATTDDHVKQLNSKLTIAYTVSGLAVVISIVSLFMSF